MRVDLPGSFPSLPATGTAAPFVSSPDGRAIAVAGDATRLIARPDVGPTTRWQLSPATADTGPVLRWSGGPGESPRDSDILAVLEAAFAAAPGQARLALTGLPVPPQGLLRYGAVLPGDGDMLRVERALFFQQARVWQPEGATALPYPLTHVQTQGRRHPLRPPKPQGVVYRRHIPWLNKSLSFRTIDLEKDLARFSRWMNDPVVAEFWQEQGEPERHRAYLHTVAADPRTLGLFGCFDGEPFGYFEVYWAKEDRIAPFCDATDHDRGWHVLIGEARFRGRPFLTAWMPSISHCLFLDDSRTQRIVIEPRIDNAKMLRSLARCGYAHLKTFDFPHKRAMLSVLLRERFFGEAVWIPGESQPATPAHPTRTASCTSTT